MIGAASLRRLRPPGRTALNSTLRRRARVVRLTARNAARLVLVRLRRLTAPGARRAELDAEFAIRTASDVASELGQMKGALMKAGQMASFIIETLPDDAQRALSSLQASAEPMAPSLAADVVRRELGEAPERRFLDWTDRPTAAASIGQVHRAVGHDGRELAVKVQYPGVDAAIESDLDAAGAMYGRLAPLLLPGLDTSTVVDELRNRIREELDYRREAANLVEFARIFDGHPTIRIPVLVADHSTRHVLTTEWVDGWSFDELLDLGDGPTRRRAGETIWRFAQHAVNRYGVFNGDPHPGNYRFHPDGTVTFLDFGLVKRWAPGEWDRLRPTLDAVVVERDPEALAAAMVGSGFLRPGHGVDPQVLYDYVSGPYQPYLTDEFTFTRVWMSATISAMADIRGPAAPVVAALDLPASFVILNRVVWGVNAILGKLEVSGPFRAMLLEYLADGDPATSLGADEAAWHRSRPTP